MPPSFLTKQGYQKLQEELEYLRTIKRHEVAERLHEAMEGGELIEDAEYEAAKNEQAFVEGRIQELEMLLANARVIEDTAKEDHVQVGSKVTIKEGDNPKEIYTIVGPAEASPGRSGRARRALAGQQPHRWGEPENDHARGARGRTRLDRSRRIMGRVGFFSPARHRV